MGFINTQWICALRFLHILVKISFVLEWTWCAWACPRLWNGNKPWNPESLPFFGLCILAEHGWVLYCFVSDTAEWLGLLQNEQGSGLGASFHLFLWLGWSFLPLENRRSGAHLREGLSWLLSRCAPDLPMDRESGRYWASVPQLFPGGPANS